MRAAFLFLWVSVASLSHAQQNNVPYVVLVSFDGFRHDYVSRFNPPHFKSMLETGVQSSGLIPSFPSKTFPNHYSIVTGLYPGHHGLVDNGFYDPKRKVFYSMKSKERVTDKYFYNGKPVWELAKEHGIRTASYFWVGSELPHNHPDYYYPYNESVIDTARVDEVLRWLRLPENERPHFISLYFSSPDHEGHTYGPEGEETKKAVLHADEVLGRLQSGLSNLSFEVNLIVVSDHGMKGLRQQQSTYIVLEELMNLDQRSLHISNGGTQAHLYLDDNSKIDSLYKSLRSKAANFRVLKQSEFPPHWHYQTPRAGDIMIIANVGYYIRERRLDALSSNAPEWFGVHGYDPKDVKDMWGSFYATGPNIKRGVKLDPFENIHIYPLMARILGLPIPAIDGSMNVLQKIYKERDKR